MNVIHRWAVRSQHGARRNAMVATTELTRRRIERDEVEAYLASRSPRRTTEHLEPLGPLAATR